MNDQENKARQNDQENKARQAAAAKGRPRTAHELAEQLFRDAGSLELTGASFEKDERFYRIVAGNLREAGHELRTFERRLRDTSFAGELIAWRWRREAFAQAEGIARTMYGLMPREFGGSAEKWRAACDGIAMAISCLRDAAMPPAPPIVNGHDPGQDRRPQIVAATERDPNAPHGVFEVRS